MVDDRARSFHQSQKQVSSDEELLEEAKVDPNKLNLLTLPYLVKIIIQFGEALADIKLYKYQRKFVERIVRSVLYGDGETLLGEFARQSGKSTSVAAVVDSLAILLPLLAEQVYLNRNIIPDIVVTKLDKFKRGFLCGVYGPDYERAAIVGSKINDALSSPKSKLILSQKDIGMQFPDRLTRYINSLPRKSRIKVKSANKRVSIEGDTHHIVITDETQEISDYVLKKSLSPMLAYFFGTTVHIGSAYPKRVYFYDVIQQQKKLDITRKAKDTCYFGVTYKEAEKYNINYKKYVEKEKIKLGEDSDEFKMSYELWWPIEKGMFISEERLINILGADYTVAPFDNKNDHAIAIDLAKVHDSTVVTVAEVDWENPIVIDADNGIIRHNKKLKNWFEIKGDDYDSQYYQICNFLNHYKWSRLAVDATGVGAPMFDRLYNKYSSQDKIIRPFVYGRESKSVGYSLLYNELLATPNRWIFPASEHVKKMIKWRRFVTQMINLAKTIEGNYLVVKHTSESGLDDYPDSLMMLNWVIEDALSYGEVDEQIGNIYTSAYMYGNKRVGRNFWQN